MGVIEFKNVEKVFGPRATGFRALEDINLEISRQGISLAIGGAFGVW